MGSIKGALVEYSSDVLGPLPNVVIFQFNPESLSRTMNLPQAASAASSNGSRTPEPNGTSGPPTESFTLTAHFSAADQLNDNNLNARLFGVGPQLTALEKMVYTTSGFSDTPIGAAIDAIASAITGSGGGNPDNVPREENPRIVFIWGPSRILPVKIKSMSISEKKYDALLNPVQAEVQIGLEIVNVPADSNDFIGKGALLYTNTVKDIQSLVNLGQSVSQIADAVDTILF